MHRLTWVWAATASPLLSGQTLPPWPLAWWKCPWPRGAVQVAEIVARLAKASDVVLDRPPAELTLSTQGLARFAHKNVAVGNARPRRRDRVSVRGRWC